MGSHKDSENPKATLPTPVTPAGRDALDAILADPGRTVIALDFDGTLAPIVPDPEQARAHPDAVPTLAALAPRVLSVAVVTGRPAAVAVRHGGFAGVPGLEHLTVLGHYGAERWDAATDTVTAPPPHPGVTAVRAELPAVLDEAGAGEGTWIEEKGRAVAVHTRRAADPQATFEVLRAPLTDLATRHGLIVEPGRMVLELRPPGMDKGVALRRHVVDSGATAVLYAGDDLGDLPAFAAVEKLRGEGVPGLLVCSGSTEVTELSERADLVVDGPEGVVRLLSRIAEVVGAGGAQ
ncbi:trehalose-phosphatase [Streptomyces neyagawaensis]|uniref:trehalose-phosphatase n=1 Tax=Streptomyces neyagawaensis TaxID=42238 RepID=UPI00201CF6B9|nr:trehalose-phosphatase [Streptomyces neyagawaensis]MCL6739116.1 trehalose-phosphatase [Streptomyces neyagawaensis]MDE1686970.1 trehalose-phosphatase [Streptomyces neyagawaensis]